MIRNEKTGRFESTKNYDYGFYSKLLNKPFDSVEELVKAETEYKKAEEDKLAKTNKKREDAKKVEEAIKARLQAEKEARENEYKAYSDYLNACKAEKAKVDEKRKAEKEALKKFCEQYGSFHSTITLDDVTYNIAYDETKKLDSFDRLMRLWF